MRARRSSPAETVANERPDQRAEYSGEPAYRRVQPEELAHQVVRRQPRHEHAVGSPRRADTRTASHRDQPADGPGTRWPPPRRQRRVPDLRVERRVQHVLRPDTVDQAPRDDRAKAGTRDSQQREAVGLRVGEAELELGEDGVEQEDGVDRVGVQEPYQPETARPRDGAPPSATRAPSSPGSRADPGRAPLMLGPRPLAHPHEGGQREDEERNRERRGRPPRTPPAAADTCRGRVQGPNPNTRQRPRARDTCRPTRACSRREASRRRRPRRCGNRPSRSRRRRVMADAPGREQRASAADAHERGRDQVGPALSRDGRESAPIHGPRMMTAIIATTMVARQLPVGAAAILDRARGRSSGSRRRARRWCSPGRTGATRSRLRRPGDPRVAARPSAPPDPLIA